MVKRSKNYFSFFGVLLATISRKLHSTNCTISTITSKYMPKIVKLLHSKQLKPIKLYSTNNL